MSYETLDTSTESAKPIYLVEFVRGTTINRFNSGPTDITDGIVTYSKSHFSMSERTQGKDIFKDSVKITFARSDVFAAEYIASIHEQTTTVTIKRTHVGLTLADAVTEWKGRIVSATTTDHEITLECESVYTSMRRLGLATQFEVSCVHTIYSAGCKADKPAKRHDGSILSISGLTYTVSGAEVFADGYFNGGMLEYSGERRFIIAHIGQDITLSRGITVGAGDTVAIYPGCDKHLTTCRDKFNNKLNYLGFPWFPEKNPFGGDPLVRV